MQKNIFYLTEKENNERKCEHEHTATTLMHKYVDILIRQKI